MATVKGMCRKWGCSEKAAPGQAYCCKEHAPFAHLSNDLDQKVDLLEMKVAPGFKGRGERRKQSPGGGSSTGSVIKGEGRIKSIASGNGSPNMSGTGSHRTPSEPESARPGMPSIQPSEPYSIGNEPTSPGQTGREKMQKTETGITATPSTPELKSANERSEEIQLTDSPNSSIKPEEAKLQSLNLARDAAEHLFRLMKCVAPLSVSEGTVLSPQVVSIACNCGKQISQLIRVQLDVAKEIRKNPKETNHG